MPAVGAFVAAVAHSSSPQLPVSLALATLGQDVPGAPTASLPAGIR